MSKSVFYLLSSGTDKYYGYVTSLRKAQLYIALHPGTYIASAEAVDNLEGTSINNYLGAYKCLDSEADETKYHLKYLYDITYIVKRGRIVGDLVNIKWVPYVGSMNNYVTTNKKWFKTLATAHLTLNYYDMDYAKEVSFKMIQDHIRNGGV